MQKFSDNYTELTTYINKLKDKYIKKYIPADPNHTPDVYMEDVNIFCIMVHSALEEYFEETIIEIVRISYDKFYKEKIITLPLLSLISHSSHRLIVNKQTTNIQIVKDELEKILKNTLTEFRAIIKSNNGIQIPHLKSMFIPVSIDLKDDSGLLDSLKMLGSIRGAFAHTKNRNKITPEKAQEIVEDCVTIALFVKKQSEAIFIDFIEILKPNDIY